MAAKTATNNAGSHDAVTLYEDLRDAIQLVRERCSMMSRLDHAANEAARSMGEALERYLGNVGSASLDPAVAAEIVRLEQQVRGPARDDFQMSENVAFANDVLTMLDLGKS